MKSAEDWMMLIGRFPADQQLDRVLKVPENLSPKVAFYNSVVSELDIEQIQSDAIIHGMELAAELCQDTEREGRASKDKHVHFEVGCDYCYKAILTAAQQRAKTP